MAKRRGKKRSTKKSKTSSSEPDTNKSDNDNNIIKEELKNFKETISGLEGKIDKMQEGIKKTRKELDDARKFVSDEIKKQQASEMLDSSNSRTEKQSGTISGIECRTKQGSPGHPSLQERGKLSSKLKSSEKEEDARAVKKKGKRSTKTVKRRRPL